jgi:large subunit ribosomal protein L15
MPKLKGFSNPSRINYQIVNVGSLNVFDENEPVDVVKLYEKKLISRKDRPVKILGEGDLKKKLELKADKFSASAKEKIEKAGGKTTEFIKNIKNEA